MTLDWTIISNQTMHQHTAHLVESDWSHMQTSINEVIDKAVALIPENIKDDSFYFLFELDSAAPQLSITLTNDSKTNDSPHTVVCGLDNLSQPIDSELLLYWIKDHLTTCRAFFHYSLVAIFTATDRHKTQLL